jgi:hypothetical protein
MEYSLKRGFKPDIDRIKKALEEEFPSEINLENGHLHTSYGALRSIEAWVEGKKLSVVTESAPGVGDQEVLDTNKRFRNFLEKATGHTAKQRMEMAKKATQKG